MPGWWQLVDIRIRSSINLYIRVGVYSSIDQDICISDPGVAVFLHAGIDVGVYIIVAIPTVGATNTCAPDEERGRRNDTQDASRSHGICRSDLALLVQRYHLVQTEARVVTDYAWFRYSAPKAHCPHPHLIHEAHQTQRPSRTLVAKSEPLTTAISGDHRVQKVTRWIVSRRRNPADCHDSSHSQPRIE